MPNQITSKSLTISAAGILSSISMGIVITSNIRDASKPVQPKIWKGIWDTGASKTCINQKIVDDLGLIPTGKIQIDTANGGNIVNTYIVDIILPSQVTIKNVIASCANLGDSIDALIGMDIITLGDFSITNVGRRTTFSFRIPSMQTIDYCKK